MDFRFTKFSKDFKLRRLFIKINLKKAKKIKIC